MRFYLVMDLQPRSWESKDLQPRSWESKDLQPRSWESKDLQQSTACIYDKNGAKIYDVSGGSVIKVIADPDNHELRIIRRVMRANIRSCVEFPAENRTGLDWYAMRRYDGHLEADEFGRSQWRSIGVQVLAFLEDLHHELGMAHMDIKKTNILVNRLSGTVHVCDFANAESPAVVTRNLRTFDPNTKWYYVGFGCELDQPMVSWRTDLVALGYLLASLQPNWTWRFEAECWEKREGRGILSEEATLELRRQEMMCYRVLEPYFTRLTLLPWTAAAEPPARSFYQELAALFTITDLH